YCIQQQVDVINLSFAPATLFSSFSDPIMAQAISDAYEQGIVIVGSSGNNRFFGFTTGVTFPANLPEVISVGAVGPSGEVAYYSDGGPTLDLVAPGGNDPSNADFTRQVLVTDSLGFSGVAGIPAGYYFQQGTSLSCGYVSSVIAMLITQGVRDETLSPTEQIEAIRTLLHTTARKPLGQFTIEYGYGIVDAAAALKAITHYIDIATPGPNETTESFAEPLEATIVQPVQSVLEEGDFQVFQNGVELTDQVDSEGEPLVEIVDPEFGMIRYVPSVESRYNIGINTLNIVADSKPDSGSVRSLEGPAEGRIPERAFRFRVAPRTEQAGLKMLSVPYQLRGGADTLQFLFGGNLVRTARWRPETGDYALWDIVGSPQDDDADLMPEPSRDLDLDNLSQEDREALMDQVGVLRPPAGLGFFARVQSPTQVQLLGKSIRSPFYEIRLKPGFNMIGNPYPFRVPWNVVNVRFGNEVMSVSEAARRNLMRNTIWRYQDGQYRFQALPQGELVNWEAHWVRSFANLTLIVPRVASILGQSRPSDVKYAAGDADAWRTGFRAVSGTAGFGEVFVGASKAGRDGYGQEDVETPPALLPGNDFRIAHQDWGRFSGRYAQDIRGAKNRVNRWTLEVATSKPGTPVKLTWDRFPAGLEGYVQVEGRSKVYPLQRGTLEFTPSRAGVQKVTVVTTGSAGA
ncbi:MAG: Subtilisin-like serine protease, partial [Armatimonadetes bacterium]|nr:Subtilisin-like serine protease [Armatimonadota bacterium]